MKILLMEKFDGISSQIPLWNGRDSSIYTAITGGSSASVTVNDSTGLYYYWNRTDTGTNEVYLKCNLLTNLDKDKSYSFVLNGLKTNAKLSGGRSGSNSGAESRTICGVEFDPVKSSTNLPGAYPFVGYTPLSDDKEYNLEVTYKNGKYSVYVNGNRTATIPVDVSKITNDLVRVRVNTDSTYGYGRTYKKGGPELQVREIIIAELEGDEVRLGNVRLERLTVKTTSENLPNPENITPVNIANNTYSLVGEEEIEISMSDISVKKGERIMGVDYRTSAVASTDGSQMEIKLLNGLEEMHTEVRNLPMVHSRASSCQIIPAQHLGDKPEDYEGVKLSIKAVEV